MATQWWREPWRKLFVKLDAKWLGLSVSARGLADELIKYADADGRLFEVASPAEAGTEIAIRLCARPKEYKRIGEDVADLLRDTYLVIAGGVLSIRNFRDAQERLSPEARRQRAKRERDKGGDNERDMSRDETVTGMRDSHRESNRSESNRIEEITPPARARVMEPVNPIAEAWQRITGNLIANSQDMAEMVDLLRRAGAEEACDPAEYITAFVEWAKDCPPGRQPQRAPRKLIENFAAVQEWRRGERRPTDKTIRDPETRPRPKPYVAGRYEEP
jgi:hypothetical protein